MNVALREKWTSLTHQVFNGQVVASLCRLLALDMQDVVKAVVTATLQAFVDAKGSRDAIAARTLVREEHVNESWEYILTREYTASSIDGL